MEGCVFQFFNLLSKFHAINVEKFTNCAVGVRSGGAGRREGRDRRDLAGSYSFEG